MVKISTFYENANVFVTGATGFLGKALVEKLLRSCDGINSIYLLVREKRGKSVEQRIEEFCKNPVFDAIKKKNPNILKKIKAIHGDISSDNLEVEDADRAFLRENINIVFHSAATVKFDENFKTAVKLNTFGTQRILELCKEMEHLKSFVYVSTAYSNVDKKEIEERVYAPSYEVNMIIDFLNAVPDNTANEIVKRRMKHPNTYTFTKNMAEQMVAEGCTLIPSAIVRPSIVIGAWKQPFSGWVDNISSVNGIMTKCEMGDVCSMICDENCGADLVPVDVVVNTIITSAWHTVAERSNAVRVYNCTSGSVNPITWGRVAELIVKYSRQYPSKYAMWYPQLILQTNALWYLFYIVLYQFIPSALLDVYLYCTNQKPMALKRSKKNGSLISAYSFFSTREWKYEISNMLHLMESVKEAEDCADFDMDCSGLDWDSYWKDYAIAVRKLILKDDLSSLSMAKFKLNRLYWVQKTYEIGLLILILYLLLTLVSYFV